MAQVSMFPPQSNSPVTELAADISSTDTTVMVVAGNLLPAAPNVATIGLDELAETIYYATKNGNELSGVIRGYDGTSPKGWNAGTRIARYLTAQDISALQHNVSDHETRINGISTATINKIEPRLVDDLPALYPIGLSLFSLTLEASAPWKTAIGHSGSGQTTLVQTAKANDDQYSIVQRVTFSTASGIEAMYERSSTVNNSWNGAWIKVVSRSEFDQLSTDVSAHLADLTNLTPSVLKIPLSSDYRAWQGVTVYNDQIYVFTDRNENFGLENIISVYSLDGKLITEKRAAYTGGDPQGRFMSFGDGNEIDGYIYVTAYNFNDGGNPLISRIIKFNISDLSVNQVYEIGGNVAESVTKHDNAFWVAYHDIAVIRKFDLNFNLLQEFSLPIQGTPPYGLSQGTFWEGNTFYVNIHGHNFNGDENPFAQLQKFEFNGTSFNYVETLSPPTDGCSQGIFAYSDFYFWNDRPSNMIVVSKSIKRGNVFSEVLPYQNEFSFKPALLNGWELYDTFYDRTARVTVLNGVIYLSGIIKNPINPNAYDGATPMFKIPSRFAPKFSLNIIGLSDKGPVRIPIVGRNSISSVDDVGNVNVHNILLYENISWISLDGISYPLF